MFQNTKLLIAFSLVIIGSGILLLGLDLKPTEIVAVPTPSITVQNQPEAPELESKKDQGVLVTKVVDGDTIEIAGGKKVRLLGVDTPETVDPRKSVQCFGKEASNEVKGLLEGKKVILEKDVSEVDKYKRLLRFVYLPLPDGTLLFVDDYLIREGYAKVLTIPPDVKFSEQFLDAQREAREAKKGLWGKC